jgi:LPS O-antigen subunit length determinant protein (WzzB/FepE family)
MNSEYNLFDLINQLYKWRRPLLRAMIAIVVVSTLCALLLPNYYKAETIFYAASPDLAKPIPIGDDEKDVRIYGDDNDLDRLFTIATSQELVTFLVDTFDLFSHYDIDSTGTKSRFKVKTKLLENFQTIKTKYGALHLTIEDKDPVMAAKLANAARERIDFIAQSIVKGSQKKQIATYAENIRRKNILSDSLAKALEKSKKSVGIFETYSQTSLYNAMLTKATSEREEAIAKAAVFKKYPNKRDSVIRYMAQEAASLRKIEIATNELKRYAPVISGIKQMEQEQARIHDQISLDKERMKQLTAAYDASFTSLHIVEKATVPVQKSRPKRSIIILLSTLIGTICCILTVFVLENLKGIKFDQTA